MGIFDLERLQQKLLRVLAYIQMFWATEKPKHEKTIKYRPVVLKDAALVSQVLVQDGSMQIEVPNRFQAPRFIFYKDAKRTTLKNFFIDPDPAAAAAPLRPLFQCGEGHQS
ncbi:MAG TPA: hypothetical protein VNK03_04720 [Gammaproteobacteria bacterium]|nr:hypothetical protein [Gammaproteobacteria bacterium]